MGTYVQIAWWGLVSPRTERRELVVVRAVVRDGDRVLLAVRNDIRGWELPGGTVEGVEALEDALEREVREETGLQVAVDRHVGAYRRTGFRPHVAQVFLCHAVGGKLQTSNESRALAWFHPLLLPDTMFRWYEEPLRDAFIPDSGPVEREERQDLATIWGAIKIDLKMRWRGDEKRAAPGSVESAADSRPSQRKTPQA